MKRKKGRIDLKQTPLLIIRHGKSHDVEMERHARFLTPLTEQGKKQTERVCDFLESLGSTSLRIVSSPAARARQTAEIIGQHFGWERKRCLSLIDASKGVLRGRPRVSPTDPTLKWLNEAREDDKWNFSSPEFGIECYRQVFKRAEEALERICMEKADASTDGTLVVTHSSVIRALVFGLWQKWVENINFSTLHAFSCDLSRYQSIQMY